MYCKIRLSQLYANEHIERFSFMMFTALACALIIELFLYSGAMQAFSATTGSSGTAGIGDEFKKILIDNIYNSQIKYVIGVGFMVVAAFYISRAEVIRCIIAVVGALVFVKAETFATALGFVLT